MASANEAGNLYVMAVSPEGQKIPVFVARNGGAISAGKSPDGVLANLTFDKWIFMPLSNVELTGGWKVQLILNMDATDGLDASDSYIDLPISIAGQGIRHLSAADLGYTTDYPAATPAACDISLGAGYTIPNGQRVRIGGDRCAISIEDDS
jgi:hypothetical protein